MNIELNTKKKEIELCFSLKEIWTLIKKRKLTMDEKTADAVTLILIQMKQQILSLSKNQDKSV